MMYIEFMQNFHLAWWNKLMAVRLISVFLNPKTFDSYFLDMMYVEFMKNFHLAWWNKLMAFTLIFASWAQKRLIPT